MSTPVDGRTTLRGRGNTSVTGAPAGASASGQSASSMANGSASSGRRATGGAGIVGGGGRASVQGVAQRLAGIEARLSLQEMGARAGQISFTSMVDGDLRVVDLLGELKLSIGVQSDGRAGITYAQGVAPPRPSMPAVSARQLFVVVGWDGTFVDDAPRPSDLARIDVHISNEQDFEPTGATAVQSMFAESVCLIPGDIEDHWVRLVAVTFGDVPSPPTDPILVRPLPADKLAAESIAAIHLASEIILGSTILAGNPHGAHLELNETGLRMVRADQTPTVVFSADEGNALITGSIQTALRSSGKSRIVFNPFPDRDWNEIRFYAPNDTAYSGLFSSRGRDGQDGAIALQGPYSAGDPYVLAVNLGESHLLGGVFNTSSTGADGTSPFSDGLLASPAQTALVGGGGPFLVHNYKRATPTSAPGPNGSMDPFIAFTNSPTSAFNGLSVLEFHEVEEAAGFRWPSIRNLGTDLRFQFGDAGFADFAFKDYNGTSYTYCNAQMFNNVSSRTVKSDIVTLDEVVDPLAAVTAVKPVRFRPKAPPERDETLWMPDPVPPNPDAELLAQLDDDLTEARQHKRDGLIPVPITPAPGRRDESRQYGLIAEEIAEVAPDAVRYRGDDGNLPMLDLAGLIGLLWGAVGQLATRVEALEAAPEP